MSKIEIELSPALAEFVRAQIEAGLYKSEQEAIEAAVRRVADDDDAKVAAVKAILARGVAEADAGKFYEGDINDIIANARKGRGREA